MEGWMRAGSLGIGYLLGTILTAEIVAGVFAGKSAGSIGTGNPGMANIMANMGKKAGLLVLAGDILKTAAAMAIAVCLSGQRICAWYAGLGAVLGHNFPVWKRGKGGKGVTCTCAWLILSMGITGILCCLAGAAAVGIWGYLPLGAVVIPLAAVPAAFVCCGPEEGILACVGAGLMLSRHIRGLARIARGEEKKALRRR